MAARLAGRLAALGRVLRHPGRHAAAARRTLALVDEFLAGGVEVDTAGEGGVTLRSVLQVDGDLQLILPRSLRDLPEERRGALVERHLREVEARLDPLGRVADLPAALMGAGGLGLLGSGGGTLYAGDASALWLLAPAAPSLLLLVASAIGPRLAWWWLRRRAARAR